MSGDIKTAVLNLLKPTQMVFLATSQDGQPFVRPMTLIVHKGQYFFATGSSDAKTGQLEANPLAEICLYNREGDHAGYVRARGVIEKITDASIRKDVFEAAQFISNYFNEPSDPAFMLFRMHWREVEYMRPGEDISTKISWN